MVDVNIGFDGLQQAAGRLQSGCSEMTGQLQVLKTMIEQLVASEFRTQLAASWFQESYKQWSVGTQNMISGLEGMAGFVDDMVREYQDPDDRLAGRTAADHPVRQ